MVKKLVKYTVNVTCNGYMHLIKRLYDPVIEELKNNHNLECWQVENMYIEEIEEIDTIDDVPEYNMLVVKTVAIYGIIYLAYKAIIAVAKL